MPDYNEIIKSIVDNWQLALGATGIVGALFFDKIKANLAKINFSAVKSILPKRKVTAKDSKAVEARDIEAIAHLRDRAVASGDETLLQEIKSVASKFFDMHSKKGNTNE
jgi:hypothetical protein